jgi:hypothetical protein
MRSDDGHDPMLRMLARLPTALPDAARADRLRARCRTAIARRRKEQTAPPPRGAASLLGPVLVGGFCLVYLAAVIHDVWRLGV